MSASALLSPDILHSEHPEYSASGSNSPADRALRPEADEVLDVSTANAVKR
jgi:hypothetical protein